MAAVMNNLVGDGNGYFGNINLKPEPAHTVSATLDLYAADRRWEQLRVTPYYTRVTDYIDAIRCPVGASCAPANRTTTNQFVVLPYANQSAELYGLDVSARLVRLWRLRPRWRALLHSRQQPLQHHAAQSQARARWLKRRGRGCGERRRVRRAQRNQDSGLRADQPARQLHLEAGAIRPWRRQPVRQVLFAAAGRRLRGSRNNNGA